MQNRRNLYRLLHVQRDAPTAVIKGSYRTLMQTLRRHPDLGGDEWDAQLLNEACRTLCDPVARARYDAAFASEPRGTAPDPTPDPTPDPAPTTAAGGDAAGTAARPCAGTQRGDEARCPYCRAGIATDPVRRGAYAPADRCSRCTAPLRPVQPASGGHGAGERRGLHRVGSGEGATVLRQWPDNIAVSATLLEFSTAGCALASDAALPDGTVVLLRTALFTATGTTRSGAAIESGTAYRIGVAFLGVEMHARPGTVLSVSV